ncbi:tripartite tricarboxylate transporter permease [Bradyrhizobium sp. LMTR 3]|uniref:tripartite tricarboxylate transporter permease n=1 Tax=Bradyrhizobium sp. LMTR 3 TaxID=189873 RepID=UPI0009FEB651
MVTPQEQKQTLGKIASAYIGNVMLLALIPMVGVWVSLLRIPHYLFIPLLLVLSVIGTYSVRNSIFDVWVLLAAKAARPDERCVLETERVTCGIVRPPHPRQRRAPRRRSRRLDRRHHANGEYPSQRDDGLDGQICQPLPLVPCAGRR